MKNLKKAAAVTMVAGGLVAAGAGVASATTVRTADGEAVSSPGVVSGNLVQAPVHVPVNVGRQHRQRHRRAEPGLRQRRRSTR